MSERTHLLVQQWLQHALPKADLNANLQQLSQTFPYFSAANLLLLKNSGAENFAERKKAVSLHVYNPLFLEADGLEKMFDFPFAEDEIITEYHEEVEEVDDVYANGEMPEEQKFEETSQEEIAVIPMEENLPAEPLVIEKQVDNEPELKIPQLNLNAPASDITFEPYHTVDYFASQGIKLSQTDVSNDQFGKQLKSFTEWLKTMKKLPTTAITHNTDGVGERKVENLAAHSLQNTDIITESMAEVWVKQGNIQKASEVYNKLSLQNPSKRAYFAAKIESLKKPS